MTKPVPPPRYVKTSKPSLGGGYGVVEIWHDTSLDRDVAIKWTAPEHVKLHLSEVQALSQHPSPHIVEIFDVVLGEAGQLRGLVLEYLDGLGLESIDLTGEADHPKAKALLYQMAQGLADLHGAGLVHRDVKPENAVCTADGRLKLVDFGFSTPGAGAFTVEAKGTMGFAAPEFFQPPPIAVSPAMDVYSFGMVCWKKLVGKIPKVGALGKPDSTRYPLPSIGTKVTLPANLVKVIDECLAWNPAKRPAMQDVADSLMAELTFGQHTACVMMPGRPVQSVTTNTKIISTFTTSFGNLGIGYDGYEFTIRTVIGDVFVNNSPAMVGERLYEGCLLTFGAKSLGGQRRFVPFRQSSPEIVF